MANENDLLNQPIQRLYQVFSKHGKPGDFPTCECCVSANDRDFLLSRKLADLTADNLSEYVADVFLTVGSMPDFKYFLPRILELSVKEEFLWPDPEVALGKLALAGWSTWPEDERSAVLDVLQHKFETLLDGNDGRSDIDKWICALGRCVEDMLRFLDQMLEANRHEQLFRFIECNGSIFTKHKLDNPFWQDARDNERVVLEWLNQPRVRSLLSERYGMTF
jgi:hypothetical protein